MSSRRSSSSSRSRALVVVSNSNEFVFDDNFIPNYENQEFNMRYRALTKKPNNKTVICCLAPNWQAFGELGVAERVRELFAKSSLRDVGFMNYPTYEGLVYEFFTTFEPKFVGGACVGWKYMIQGRAFERSSEEICDMLNVPGTGTSLGEFSEARLKRFWVSISTMSTYNFDCSPKSINSFEWKIIHRLVAININSRRDEGSRVSKDDLRMMLAMELGAPLNYFKIITTHLHDMANIHGTVKGLGCSSLITLLASKEGFYFSGNPDDFKPLGLDRMTKIKMRDPDTGSHLHEVITPSRSSRRASRSSGRSSFVWEETEQSYPGESSNAIVPYHNEYSGEIVLISSDDG